MSRLPLVLLLLLFVAAAASSRPAAGQAGASEGGQATAAIRQAAAERYLDGELAVAADLYHRAAAAAVPAAAGARDLLAAAWLEHTLGRESRALDTLSHALELDPETPIDASLYSSEFVALARAAGRAALHARRAEASRLIQAALDSQRAGRPDAARRDLERALELDPANAAALLDLALLDLEANRGEAAATALESVLVATADDPAPTARVLRGRALLSLGLLAHRESEWRQAEERFQEATVWTPDQVEAWTNLARVRLLLDDSAGAVQALDRALVLAPADPQLQREMVQALSRADRWQDAGETVAAALRIHPHDAGLLLDQGIVQRALGDRTAAAASLGSALELASTERPDVAAAAASYLALTLYESGDAPAAAASARAALERRPAAAENWNILGLALLAESEPESALSAFEKATELDAGRPEYANNRGSALVQLERFEEAETAFVAALTLAPDFADARANLERVRALDAPPAPGPPTAAARAAAPRPRRTRPIQPKQIGLRFAELDYRKLRLRGALVKEVKKRTPAARAGLRKGDLVLRLDRYAVESDRDFFSYLKRNPPGAELEIEVLRDGRTESFRLDLGRG